MSDDQPKFPRDDQPKVPKDDQPPNPVADLASKPEKLNRYVLRTAENVLKAPQDELQAAVARYHAQAQALITTAQGSNTRLANDAAETVQAIAKATDLDELKTTITSLANTFTKELTQTNSLLEQQLETNNEFLPQIAKALKDPTWNQRHLKTAIVLGVGAIIIALLSMAININT